MVAAVAHSPHSAERHISPGDGRLQQLRQTLARSPSKGPQFRLFSPRASPTSTSPRSPANQTFSDATTSLFSMNGRRRKPLAAMPSPGRPARNFSNPRNAPRRVLQESTDHGNSGLQNMVLITSPDEMRISPDENMLAPYHAIGRKEKAGYFDIPPKSSPLKRSESKFDVTRSVSPSAKRRSVHGASYAQDYNPVDQENLFEDTSDLPTPTPQFSPPVFRRRAQPRLRLSNPFDTVPSPKSRPPVGNMFDIQTAKAKNRLSLDHLPIPDENNESPFSFDTNAIQQPKELPTLGKLTLPARHPLSRTITQSSSSSDIPDDSPTHAPIRNLGGFRKPYIDFTRSLPIGASRPQEASQDSDCSSFATPANYKFAKPNPAAFLSTGLISKKNRNLTEEQMNFRDSTGEMPDTPCKRPLAVPVPVPQPTPNISLFKARGARQSMPAFGTPSAPFNPRQSTNRPAIGETVFGSDFNSRSTRRGSFAESVQDAPKSPVMNFHRRNPSFYDLPPTPTKASNTPNNSKIFRYEDFPIMDGKSISIPEIKVAGFSEMDESCLSSPSPKLRFRDPETIPSFSNRSTKLKMRCPSPLSIFSTASSSDQAKLFPIANPDTKSSTPKDYPPPDPSNLFISGEKTAIRRPSFNDSLIVNLPATPTAARDSFGKLSMFNASVTPSSHHPVVFNNIDSSITSRFDKVEPLGGGEFSQVWKTYIYLNPDGTRDTSRRGSKDPGNSKLSVVKKVKEPFLGVKDRVRKFQEAEILKALVPGDHIVQYFNHWEYQDHLYIETEYCEEGTLATFLADAGQKARLDDFRIWKIMLELARGIQHIHDSNFIHLDIKPANILVTFSGVLKIGDFGLATTWPAPPNIDGEGDREYLAPESLNGKFDKPSDIFAFGLMMLEIAGNVVLPDNGTAWVRLRSGDMTDVPSLTSSSDICSLARDSSGNPLESPGQSFSTLHTDPSFAAFDFGFEPKLPSPGKGHRFGELRDPPEFMTNPLHTSALDKVVEWMISPDQHVRPLIADILACEGVQWVGARRRAGATIYEGNFGPADEVLNHDSEMIDV